MITLRIESLPAFHVIGEKTFITGQDNAQFGDFWTRAHQSGLVERLKALSKDNPCAVTGSDIFGVSRVEKDPNVRAFDFWIACECERAEGLDGFTVPACRWAIFGNRGALPMSLVNAEMYAFMEWLPSSGYTHALAPELEVYPRADADSVEFWLPIQESK